MYGAGRHPAHWAGLRNCGPLGLKTREQGGRDDYKWRGLICFLSDPVFGSDILLNMGETDLQLLTRYAQDRVEDAFAELVRRHLDLVHSAALRQVRSRELAEEVAQAVFMDLARQAAKIPAGTVLSSWLYTITRHSAIDVVRREASRRLREQLVASDLNAMEATDDWSHIEPLLDEAMGSLDETDRTAVLLRYFENRSLRDLGQALGISEDAAQKRVSRAVERLREFMAKRGFTAGTTGLVALISANAVQTAPAGLALSVLANAGVTGTAVVAAASTAATKTFVMTTLQKTLFIAAFTAAVGTGIYEAQQVATLRKDVATLQQQLETERNSSAPAPAPIPTEPAADAEQAQKDKTELLQLRNEVGQLRGQIAALRAMPFKRVPQADTQVAEIAKSKDEEMRQLGLAASQGDITALRKLEELTRAATARRRENPNSNEDTHHEIRIAFKVMGEEAGKGSATALQALWQSTRMDYLGGMAIYALGDAAAMGNEQALETLLNPKKYLMDNSSTTGALVPAAKKGNPRAIEYLATVASDSKKQPEWGLVTNGLRDPAAEGNATAIDALALIGRSENENLRNTAVRALQNASFNNHPRAIEALRNLGYK